MKRRYFQPHWASDARTFHLTVRDAETVAIYAFGSIQVLFLLFIFLAQTHFSVFLGLTAIIFFGLLTSRRGILVTREGAWGQIRFFGLTFRSDSLGRSPRVASDGWDWEEIAVTPLDESLRIGLHDDERFVLATWNSGLLESPNSPNREIDAAANALMERLREEIARLHSVT